MYIEKLEEVTSLMSSIGIQTEAISGPQKAVLDIVSLTPGEWVSLTDISRRKEFLGVHFLRIQKAADSLVKKGTLDQRSDPSTGVQVRLAQAQTEAESAPVGKTQEAILSILKGGADRWFSLDELLSKRELSGVNLERLIRSAEELAKKGLAIMQSRQAAGLMIRSAEGYTKDIPSDPLTLCMVEIPNLADLAKETLLPTLGLMRRALSGSTDVEEALRQLALVRDTLSLVKREVKDWGKLPFEIVAPGLFRLDTLLGRIGRSPEEEGMNELFRLLEDPSFREELARLRKGVPKQYLPSSRVQEAIKVPLNTAEDARKLPNLMVSLAQNIGISGIAKSPDGYPQVFQKVSEEEASDIREKAKSAGFKEGSVDDCPKENKPAAASYLVMQPFVLMLLPVSSGVQALLMVTTSMVQKLRDLDREAMKQPVTPERLAVAVDRWVKEVQQLRHDEHKKSGYKFKPDVIKFERGKKYYKVYAENPSTGGRNVVAFIDPDGNVLKPASWKAPAKGIRGNIFLSGAASGTANGSVVYNK